MIFLNQPRGLYVLAIGSLFERFSYYGALAILILYTIRAYNFTSAKSYLLYGAYTAFAFALPVAGGLIADRLLNLKHAIKLGLILLISGNCLLLANLKWLFYCGLAAILCGAGIYKSNAQSLLSELYLYKKDAVRDLGFTFLYMAMNIGATLGAIVYTSMAHFGHWHGGFMVSIVGLVLSFLIFIKYDFNPNLASHLLKHRLTIYSVVIISCLLIAICLNYPAIVGGLVITLVLALIVTALKTSHLYSNNERKHLLFLFSLFFFTMCFFIASLQVTSSITVFIDHFAKPSLFGLSIPSSIFSSLYPFAVILLSPAIIYLWRFLNSKGYEPSIIVKLALGLILGAIAFIWFCFMAKAISTNNNYKFLSCIVIANLFLGAGELIIFPPLLAATTKFAPHNIKSTMIGICLLFVAFAGYLNGLINEIAYSKLINTTDYLYLFLTLSIILLAAALILLILAPTINQLIKNS